MADYSGPGNQSPGSSFRAAPYSRVFAAGANPGSLIGVVEQARGATTGCLVLCQATSVTLTYKDSSGTQSTFTSTQVVGDTIDLMNVAMTEISVNTGCIVIAYWHGQASR